MAPVFLLLGVAGAAGIAYLIFGGKEPKELPGSGSNVPRPGDDPTRIPYSLPDGTVIQTHPTVGFAIYQAIATGDPEYMRNTAKQLRELGWTNEANQLEKIANQVPKPGSGTITTPSVVSQTQPAELPAQVLAGMKVVVERQNPAEMKAYAQKLRQAGYIVPAQQLEAAAALIEAAQQAQVPTVSVTTPSTPPSVVVATPQLPTPAVTPIQLPPMVVTPQAEVVTPRRAAADMLVKHLMVDNPSKGKEDQGLVRNYQALAGRSVDGKYGPGDAKSLYDAASGRHVPPPPRYWPKSNYAAAKRDYDQWLAAMQTADPARADEFAQARANSGRYYPS
jgi:hypothetical protein